MAVNTDHGFYLAADSRITRPTGRTDEAQKIFLCGTSAIIAISGALILEGSIETISGKRIERKEDLTRLLADFSCSYSGDNSGLVQSIVDLLYGPVLNFWRIIVAPSPDNFLAQQEGNRRSIFTISGVANFGGRSRVFEIEFPFLPSGAMGEPSAEFIRSEIVYGWGMTVMDDGLVRDLTNPKGVLDYISALYCRSADQHPGVGGPIDIGYLYGNNLRWIVRKNLDESTISFDKNS